ncbi:MAG: ice-binding family protein, partial [Hymenobacteraceae bacterium]|nr:ice-binding family protein [Hymenobacteraceae bacterium]
MAQVRPVLGATANFTVLAGTEIRNADTTVIYGNIGVWPGNTIIGFPPGVVNGSQHAGNTTAQLTQLDLAVAYTQVAVQVPTANLSGQNLGGRTVLPGVYRYDANADQTGTLTFDANGDPSAVFIIQVLGNLTASPGAAMNLRGGARPSNIFWQVGNSMTIGAGSNLVGSFLVNQSATLGASVSLQGRILAQHGHVHLLKNMLDNPLPTSDLNITKTAPKVPYSRGQQITFEIIVSNFGPRDEANVIVRDKLPSGLTYISSTTTRSTSYDPVTGIWGINQFRNGDVDTLRIVARIDTTGFITNSASIAGTGIDSDQSNNTASVSFCASPQKAGIINGPISLCLDTSSQAQTYVYSIQPVQGATSYKWYTPTGWNIIGRSDTTFITIRPGTDTLSATLVVAPVNVCGESPPSTIVVYATNLPPSTPGAINGNPNVCIGQTGITYTVPNVWGATSYTWAVPTGWTITSGQGTNSITVTAGSSPGAISVSATNGCGTSAASTFLVTPAGA